MSSLESWLRILTSIFQRCEVHLRDVQIAEVYECIDKSLDLFDRTYSSAAPGLGGWYHRLEATVPGPSATSVALHSYLLVNRIPARLTESLAFLKFRQVISSDALITGGWPVNTSAGRPVLEATSLVVRLLGSGHLMMGSGAPDAALGYKWIVTNQNPDGGWGSFLDQPSRVWLTAMALRALVEMNLNDISVASGVEWLLRARDPQSLAWGEQPNGPATVTHTSFVLTCLVESRIGGHHPYVVEAIRKGFEWLHGHLDTSVLHDSARVESYNVSYVDGERTSTWQNSVWHPSLPYALAALVRHPNGGDPALIAAAVQRIVSSQSSDGRWTNADGAAGISVWSVWPYLDALSDFVQKTPIRGTDRVTWLPTNSILIRRNGDRSISVARLAWRFSSARLRALLQRYWATLLLLLTLLAGVVLTLLKILEAQEFLFALALPITLVAIQELLARSRPSSRGQ